MNSTPKGNRPHIAVFGRRNFGKSSLINALTNQKLAIVSSVAGTTADPVYKAMELLPVGPVMMIDTAGIDDEGDLGKLRVKKTKEVIRKTDLALIVFDDKLEITDFEIKLYEELKKFNVKTISVINKKDKIDKKIDYFKNKIKDKLNIESIAVSSKTKEGINPLRNIIAKNLEKEKEKIKIIGDLINKNDTVVLVTPIDSAAPKGRLILPQVQTIRDILDHDAINIITKENTLSETLKALKEKPKMVVTDSQAFNYVNKIVPDDIMLTGFSVLFARYKGDLKSYIKGINAMNNLKENDNVLIAEACTHKRQKNDIGTVKIPRWLEENICCNINFEHTAGRDYPDNLDKFDLIIHCGGCMLNRKEVISRIKIAKEQKVPIINYGIAIANLHGILDRALEPFEDIYNLWKMTENINYKRSVNNEKN